MYTASDELHQQAKKWLALLLKVLHIYTHIEYL